MPRSRFVHAAATGAAALMLLLGAMSCSSNHVRGSSRPPPSGATQADYSSEGDYGENAMATVEPPPAYTSPPPPQPVPPVSLGERDDWVPPRQAHAVQSAHGPPKLTAPATDTAAEGPDEAPTEPFAGLGTFAKPPVLTVGIPYTLKFYIGRNEAGLKNVSEGREMTDSHRIWMAQTMRVTLDPNPDFVIKPQNPDQEIQDLSPDSTAAWFWIVTPLHQGHKKTLTARVQALVRGPDGELVKGPDGQLKGRYFPATTVDVDVRVSGKARIGGLIEDASWLAKALGGMFETWKGMLVALAALITAAGGVWAAVRKLKGGGASPS